MSHARSKYLIGNADLFSVNNRNEMRVAECLRTTLESLGNPELPEKVLFDAYAYALNQLPARYVQSGSIVLRDPVRKEDIQKVVNSALQRVLKNPKA